MTELLLPDIKATALALLIHFRDFCQENNIRFYLSNGTLLGAVKYGGFIPWDDDVDVFVPRGDYDRLLKIYQNTDRYQLFSPDREPAYRYPFAKLCDMTTLKVEANVDNGVQLGLDVDIFPLDTCSGHILKFNVMTRIKAYLLGCSLSKFVSVEGKPFYKRCIIGCCRVLGFGFFHRRLLGLVRKESLRGKGYMGCLMWPIYGEREIIPAEVFSEAVEVEFEGERFPAPAGYDTYLRSVYGEYEIDPPLEKQKSHHQYRAFSL